MLTPKVPVAKEGYPFIGFAAFSALFAALCDMPITAALAFAGTTFILCFFRDPERFTPTGDDLLVCPADGKVIGIDQVQDNSFTGKEALRISIFMNVFNVHVNRVPCRGKVDNVIYRPGKFYSADSKRGGLENEYCATVMTTGSGEPLAFVQIAGLIARRIVCWLEPGDDIQTGRRYGLIRFGSRVDLYVPLDTKIVIHNGEKVKAGETVLGYLR